MSTYSWFADSWLNYFLWHLFWLRMDMHGFELVLTKSQGLCNNHWVESRPLFHVISWSQPIPLFPPSVPLSFFGIEPDSLPHYSQLGGAAMPHRTQTPPGLLPGFYSNPNFPHRCIDSPPIPKPNPRTWTPTHTRSTPFSLLLEVEPWRQRLEYTFCL